MSRSSQTELAVLGALSVEPMTGYQVRNAIRDTLGAFWAESFGQIYPALGRLEADGLVARASGGKTSGSVFRLTDSGRTALRQLLSRPAEGQPPRNGLLLRLFFGDQLGPAACRALVEDAAGQAQESLAQYAQLRREIEAEPPTPGRPYRLMVLAAGEHSARAAESWARECLDTLTAAESPPPSRRAPSRPSPRRRP